MRLPRPTFLTATALFLIAQSFGGCDCGGGTRSIKLGTGGAAGGPASGGTSGIAGAAGAGGKAGGAGAGGLAGGAGGATGGSAGAAAGGGGHAALVDGGQTDAAKSDASAVDAAIACDDGGVPEAGVTGSRVLIQFDSIDPERVTNLQWVESSSVTTQNLAASGGPLHCTDPQEFFGQAYSAPENTLPSLVIGGHLASLVTCGARVTITGAAADCTQAAQVPVTTTYQFYSGAHASQVQITRTFGFDATTPVYSSTGLRPYVPRVPLGTLGTVLYPNQDGTAVTSASASSCGGDCFVTAGTSWNGRWFADVDTTSGLALIVLRDPSVTSPVDLTVNNDGFSGSNLASFVLLQPDGGWKAPVTEIEYLCFADLTSWPQTDRDTAVLPAGCGP